MSDKIQKVAEFLAKAKAVVVLTGAGVSKESGIPTFRDAQTGLWANFNPEDLATPRAFRRNPSLVWQWYDYRRQAVENVEPNPGHVALVELEKQFPKFTLITQNVDGLHARAGSKNVVELHGNITLNKCFDNEHRASDVPFGLKDPPKCYCGSLIRPDVVWFEEALPFAQLNRAKEACEACHVMLVVGTSGLVHPAASLPFVAARAKATLVEINPGKTPLTSAVDIYLDGPSGEILPAVVRALERLNRRI